MENNPNAHIPPAPRRRNVSSGLVLGLVITICVCIVMVFSIASCSSIARSTINAVGGTAYETQIDQDCIGVINISGSIQYDGSTSSPDGLKAQLERAEKNPHVKGVILKVNSGGGTATAGEEMSALVKDFKKPIVVSSQATNASAAYEISSQADYIFTDKTTAIGSIGVLMQITDVSGLYDILGIKIETIASADSKDASSGNRPLTEEERAWYQAMVDQINEDFIETVATGRDMSIESVRELANGLPYTGIDAVEVGLADEIGGFEEALEYISKEVGSETKMRTTTLKPQVSQLQQILNLLSEYDGSFTGNLANDKKISY